MHTYMQLGIAHDKYFDASLMFMYNYYKDIAAILYVKKLSVPEKIKSCLTTPFN